MKRPLRILAGILILAVVAFWLATGANRGWSKTSVPINTVDAVTGLDHIEWQKKFVPGIDFLAAALVAAGVLAGASLLVRSKKPGT